MCWGTAQFKGQIAEEDVTRIKRVVSESELEGESGEDAIKMKGCSGGVINFKTQRKIH